MTSEVEICNSALVKIGGEVITSLSDTSVSAIAVNQQFARVRDHVLASHPWNFALRRASLALIATAPAFGYSNQFQLPTDCVRVIKVQYSDIEFKIEGRALLTDESEIQVQYLSNSVDVADYPPHFAETLAAFLAADVSYRITQSSAVQKQALDTAQLMLRNARTMDAQEGTPETLEASEWVNSRY